MKSPKRDRPERPVSDHVREGDGVDPRRFFGRSSRPRDEHRLGRLCSEVARIAAGFLVFEDLGEASGAVDVLEAVPAPDASRLEVRIGVPAGLAPDARERLRAALEAERLPLRAEIARVVNRRRAPDVVFRLVPREEERP